jgi:hypothetical protein
MSNSLEQQVPGVSRPGETFASRWHRLPTAGKVALWIVAIALVFQFANSLFSGLSGSSNGVTGRASSFDHSAAGSGALAQLLTQQGHGVNQLASNLSPTSLSGTKVLFSLDPSTWNAANTQGVSEVLRHGGTVVVSGRRGTTALLAKLDSVDHIAWISRSVGLAQLTGTTSFRHAVSILDSPGPGSFRITSSSLVASVLARGRGGVLALAFHHRGWLILVSNSSPFLDGHLAAYDNAAFALNLAQPSASTVTFDEFSHGVGRRGQGLAGLSAPWRFGLGAILLSLILWIVSASRRFGPAQRLERNLIPPRIGYVDAMATLLRSRSTPDLVVATAPVRTELRKSLAQRFGLVEGADDKSLMALGNYSSPELGSFAGFVQHAVEPASSNEDIINLGRALAQLKARKG